MADRLWLRLALAAATLVCATGCGDRDRKADLSFAQPLPATSTALALCPNVADCRATALWRRFEPGGDAAALLEAGPVVLFQNEYSPAFLLPANARVVAAGEARMHRGLSYILMANQTARKSGTPADQEQWAGFRMPQSGRWVVGGEAAVTDAIDVAAGVKPALTSRRELIPLLGRFGSGGGAAGAVVEYSFSQKSQLQGIEGAIGAVLGSWPVRVVLGPVTSYRGRAMKFERDGARCRARYGFQLANTLAARGLRGAIATAMSAGTFAGWPLGPEYPSAWRAEREGDLVVLTAELTKAGCEDWQKR